MGWISLTGPRLPTSPLESFGRPDPHPFVALALEVDFCLRVPFYHLPSLFPFGLESVWALVAVAMEFLAVTERRRS